MIHSQLHQAESNLETKLTKMINKLVKSKLSNNELFFNSQLENLDDKLKNSYNSLFEQLQTLNENTKTQFVAYKQTITNEINTIIKQCLKKNYLTNFVKNKTKNIVNKKELEDKLKQELKDVVYKDDDINVLVRQALENQLESIRKEDQSTILGEFKSFFNKFESEFYTKYDKDKKEMNNKLETILEKSNTLNQFLDREKKKFQKQRDNFDNVVLSRMASIDDKIITKTYNHISEITKNVIETQKQELNELINDIIDKRIDKDIMKAAQKHANET